MTEPVANKSREAVNLRKLAVEYGQAVFVESTDPQDRAGKRLNSRLLKAALSYAEAVKKAELNARSRRLPKKARKILLIRRDHLRFIGGPADTFFLKNANGSYSSYDFLPWGACTATIYDIETFMGHEGITHVEISYGHSIQDCLNDESGYTFADGLYDKHAWILWMREMQKPFDKQSSEKLRILSLCQRTQ